MNTRYYSPASVTVSTTPVRTCRRPDTASASQEETPTRPSSANCPGGGALNATNSPSNPMGQDQEHIKSTMLSVVSTTTTQTSHPQDRLRNASEPPTPASALYLVKAQVTGTRHPSPNQSQHPGQGPSDRPYCYRGSDSSPL